VDQGSTKPTAMKERVPVSTAWHIVSCGRVALIGLGDDPKGCGIIGLFSLARNTCERMTESCSLWDINLDDFIQSHPPTRESLPWLSHPQTVSHGPEVQ